MTLDWSVIWEYRGELAAGLQLTAGISAAAIVGATIVGVLIGCARSLPGFLSRRASALYIETMRNIPIIVKLFFAHFVLGLDALAAGIIVLILHQSAYIADVTAAGLRSVPVGQTETALSSGMSYRQVLLHVLLPQAAPSMIPPLTTQWTQVVKNSSIVMLIALQELTFMAQRIEQQTFRGIEAATTATILYGFLVLSIVVVLSVLQRLLERSRR